MTSSVLPHGQLLDDEHEPGTVVDDGVAGERLGPPVTTWATSPMRSGLAVALGQRHLGQVLRRDDRQLVADPEPLVRRVDEPTGADEPALGELQEPGVEGVRRSTSITWSSGTSGALELLRVRPRPGTP